LAFRVRQPGATKISQSKSHIMSTNSSILDDFLIDTTRLSLIRRYKPPFELDKLVLSAEKRSSMLELMRQQRDAAKEAAAEPQTTASTDDKMDVEPPAPTAIAAVSDDSKMDVDEPNTSLKEENASESNHTDSDADQRLQLKRKRSSYSLPMRIFCPISMYLARRHINSAFPHCWYLNIFISKRTAPHF
jgi:hypothetical protein